MVKIRKVNFYGEVSILEFTRLVTIRLQCSFATVNRRCKRVATLVLYSRIVNRGFESRGSRVYRVHTGHPAGLISRYAGLIVLSVNSVLERALNSARRDNKC